MVRSLFFVRGVMIEFLVFGLLSLSVLCLWILIEGRKNPKFLALFIPIILVLVTSTYITYTSILGFPKNTMPEEGVYLKHYVDEPNWIYLWIIENDNVPRSYRIPYDRNTHNSLEEVEGESNEGNFMVLKESSENSVGEEDGDRREGYTIGGEKQFYKWEYKSEMMRKE